MSEAHKSRNYFAWLTILVCVLSVIPFAKEPGIWLLEKEQAAARSAQAWQPWSIARAYQRQVRRLLPGAEPDNPPEKPLDRKPPTQVSKQPEPADSKSTAPLAQADIDRALELGPLIDDNGKLKPLPPGAALPGPELRKELAARVDPKSPLQDSTNTDLERALELQKGLANGIGKSGLTHSMESTIPPEDTERTPLGAISNWANQLDPNWFVWLGPFRGSIVGTILTAIVPIQTTYLVGKDLLAGDAPFYGIGVMVVALLVGVHMISSQKIAGFWKTLGSFWLAFFSVVGCCSILAWLLQAFLIAGAWHKVLVWMQGPGLETGVVGLVILWLEGGYKTLEFAEASEKLGVRIPILATILKKLS